MSGALDEVLRTQACRDGGVDEVFGRHVVSGTSQSSESSGPAQEVPDTTF